MKVKRLLLWSFERGSIHYDIICGVILAFILFTPSCIFHDRPDFMLVAMRDPNVRPSHDDDGNLVYTVKLQTSVFAKDEENREAAIQSLAEALNMPVKPEKMERVHDYTGALVAYAIWIKR